MTIIAAVLITAAAILFTLVVRKRDLPPPEPASSSEYIEERKSAIRENLNDLQFEYSVGKLSESDYQQTKSELQKELAGVAGTIENDAGPVPESVPEAMPARPEPAAVTVCPRCGATFSERLKFCGECGNPLTREKA